MLRGASYTFQEDSGIESSRICPLINHGKINCDLRWVNFSYSKCAIIAVNTLLIARFEVFTAVRMVMLSLVLALCRFVGRRQRFEETYIVSIFRAEKAKLGSGRTTYCALLPDVLMLDRVRRCT